MDKHMGKGLGKLKIFGFTLTAFIAALLLGAASFALYQTIDMGGDNLIDKMGVSNPFLQNLIILAIIIVALVIIGGAGFFGFKPVIKKVVKG